MSIFIVIFNSQNEGKKKLSNLETFLWYQYEKNNCFKNPKWSHLPVINVGEASEMAGIRLRGVAKYIKITDKICKLWTNCFGMVRPPHTQEILAFKMSTSWWEVGLTHSLFLPGSTA